ncbi:hypothetical protein WR25_19346 isoform H [Diploscapter pachys]|nr:hypothetical protein WR25_19346 isoform H [Diploscapter pachys]
MDLSPSALYTDFSAIHIDVTPRACHSFRRTYAALCDFYDQPYREEVAWDVEKIYTINRLRDLRVEDFSHLLPKDLLPIVGVLQYSTYFTGLVADGVRVLPDLVDVILTVVRRSPNLHKLSLRNCALPRDFMTLFASALQNCQSSSLEYLDLSKNVLDDKKGFTALSTALPKMSMLRRLNLSECQLSEKCTQLLCSGLYSGITSSKAGSSVFSHLDLSSNLIKDDVSSLVNLVSLCQSLRVLDLTDTSFPLDKLWSALKFGGLQIEKLYLGGCFVGKRPAETCQLVKEYFSIAVNLSHINFSNTVLPSETMKSMLLGLASNQQLKPFRLDMDSVCEKGTASVIETCVGGIRCESLSLRDNNFEGEMQPILQALSNINCLRRLDIGGNNLVALKRSSKPQHAAMVNKILLDIVKLYSDDSSLEELILSEAKLGSHLSVLLNTLGATTSLKSLDISSNEMGNFGARILSKALQLNVSLRSLSIDNNKIGSEGFTDIASSMQMNHTLLTIPYPVNDVIDSAQRTDKPRVVAALQQIQYALDRNRTASGAADEANCKKMLTNGLQQLIDRSDGDVARRVNDMITTVKNETMPARLEEMVDDFVEQIRREASLSISEQISKLGELPSSSELPMQVETVKAERIAADRLKELWTEQLRSVISDWRWRELCEKSESVLRSASAGTASVGSNVSFEGSPNVNNSMWTSKRSNDSSHRPRSIIGELSPTEENQSPPVETGVSLDTPPKPSALVHLQKARPKKRVTGNGMGVSQQTIPEDSMVLSRCTDLTDNDADDSGSTRSEDSERREDPVKKPLSDRPGFRAAMLPDAALLSQIQLRPATDRVASPKFDSPRDTSSSNQNSAPASPKHPIGNAGNTPSSCDSPPALPARTRMNGSGGTSMLGSPTPPCLPPKPEPRMRVASPEANSSQATAPPLEDNDENANSTRRSVADMARMFSK